MIAGYVMVLGVCVQLGQHVEPFCVTRPGKEVMDLQTCNSRAETAWSEYSTATTWIRSVECRNLS